MKINIFKSKPKFETKHVISAILIFSLAINAYLFLQLVGNTSNDLATRCQLSAKISILEGKISGNTIQPIEYDLQKACMKAVAEHYPWYIR